VNIPFLTRSFGGFLSPWTTKSGRRCLRHQPGSNMNTGTGALHWTPRPEYLRPWYLQLDSSGSRCGRDEPNQPSRREAIALRQLRKMRTGKGYRAFFARHRASARQLSQWDGAAARAGCASHCGVGAAGKGWATGLPSMFRCSDGRSHPGQRRGSHLVGAAIITTVPAKRLRALRRQPVPNIFLIWIGFSSRG